MKLEEAKVADVPGQNGSEAVASVVVRFADLPSALAWLSALAGVAPAETKRGRAKKEDPAPAQQSLPAQNGVAGVAAAAELTAGVKPMVAGAPAGAPLAPYVPPQQVAHPPVQERVQPPLQQAPSGPAQMPAPTGVPAAAAHAQQLPPVFASPAAAPAVPAAPQATAIVPENLPPVPMPQEALIHQGFAPLMTWLIESGFKTPGAVLAVCTQWQAQHPVIARLTGPLQDRIQRGWEVMASDGRLAAALAKTDARQATAG